MIKYAIYIYFFFSFDVFYFILYNSFLILMPLILAQYEMILARRHAQRRDRGARLRVFSVNIANSRSSL